MQGNSPNAHFREGNLKYNFFYNPTEKVIEIIIVEFDELILLVTIQYGRKIGMNYSELGSKCQIYITDKLQITFLTPCRPPVNAINYILFVSS